MGLRHLLLVAMLLAIPLCHAATLTGTAYTQDLQVAKYALLTINTTPAQRIILEEGTYNISVPRGSYLIRIELMVNGHVYDDELVVDIKDAGFVRNIGNYTYDFILFRSDRNATVILPELEEVNLSPPDEPLQMLQAAQRQSPWLIFAGITLVILLAAGYAVFLKRQGKATQPRDEPTPIPADLDNVLQLIKKEGGRTTQKELRKHVDCSEAKLSMMLTELEAKGKVEKIKKGRGNLIVLKR